MLQYSRNAKSFTTSFELVPIPCGVGKTEGSIEQWRVYVVCFPNVGGEQARRSGISLSVGDLDEGRIIDQLIHSHPLCRADADYRMRFRLCNGDEIPIHSRVVDGCDLSELAMLLRTALVSAGSYSRMAVGDDEFGVLTDDDPSVAKNYVDVRRLYESYCKHGFHAFVTQSFLKPAANEPLSWASSRTRLEEQMVVGWHDVAGNASRSGCMSIAALLNDDDLVKYEWMLRQNGEDQDLPKHDTGFAIAKQATPPDDLVFAILQDAELAKRLGLIVELEIEVDRSAVGTESLEGVLTLEIGPRSRDVASADRSSTALSREYLNHEVFVVQPLSKYEDRKFNLLTCLRTRPAGGARAAGARDEYAFQSFNMDHSVVRSLLMPNIPGENEEEDRPMYKGTFAIKGFNPPAGSGVTLIGPKRDLVSESEQPGRSCNLPWELVGDMEFFEDIWDGYRLDVATEASPGAEFSRFLSIHSQRLQFSYQSSDGKEHSLVVDETEDFIFRDQRTSFRKPAGVCQAEVEEKGEPRVHPALFTWSGTGTIAEVPWSCKGRLRPYDSRHIKRDYVRDRKNKVVARHPSLEYGKRQLFRLRNVLQAGIGLGVADANRVLEALQSSTSKHPDLFDCVAVEHLHTRNRPYSPGVFVFPPELEEESEKGTDTRFQIGGDRDSIDVWLYPAPLDREEARYHGLLRKAWKQGANLSCVEGKLPEFIREVAGLGRGEIGYYADPDVKSVSIDTWILGNHWLDTEPNKFVDRFLKLNRAKIRCTDVMPHHVGDASQRLNFGQDDSFGFRPILLRFKASRSPRPKVRCSELWNGIEKYELSLPPGDLARLEILPALTYGMVSSSTMSSEYLSAQLSGHALGDGELDAMLRGLAKLPGLTAPLVLEVVHAVPAALDAPTIERLVVRDGDNREQKDVQVYRKPGETAVTFNTGVQVDPRTTGSVSLKATWKNYIDDPAFPRPTIVGTPLATTSERSVYFGLARHLDEELCPMTLSATQLSRRAQASEELYCIERSVLFGDHDSAHCDLASNPPEDRSAQVEIGDLRHYRVSVRAIATGRYAAEFSDDPSNVSVQSEPVTVNVPSSISPPPPRVSHVLPLTEEPSFALRDGRKVLNRHQILRIYLHRPWNVSGEGEMLAFVFDKSWRAANHRDVKEIPSPTTAWGEDPAYRTYESETVDNISPATLASMLRGYADQAEFDDDYPTLLQTEVSSDRFNVVSKLEGETMEEAEQDLRAAHLVCVRPSFDERERLWYVDLDPGDRYRWFRCEFRGYQHHSLDGFHMSKERTVVNFFSTRSDTVTVTRRINVIEITLDTVPYSGVPTDENAPYEEGRYQLARLRSAEDSIFVYPFGEVPPRSVHRTDPGNMRYVWKLPADNPGIYAIRDNLRERNIVKLDLSKL